MRGFQHLGLTARLMIASGVALLLGGGAVLGALTARDAARFQSDLHMRAQDELNALVPLIVDQAVVGDYFVIQEIIAGRTRSAHIRSIEWTDRRGATVRATDDTTETAAPSGSDNSWPSKRLPCTGSCASAASTTEG